MLRIQNIVSVVENHNLLNSKSEPKHEIFNCSRYPSRSLWLIYTLTCFYFCYTRFYSVLVLFLGFNGILECIIIEDESVLHVSLLRMYFLFCIIIYNIKFVFRNV